MPDNNTPALHHLVQTNTAALDPDRTSISTSHSFHSFHTYETTGSEKQSLHSLQSPRTISRHSLDQQTEQLCSTTPPDSESASSESETEAATGTQTETETATSIDPPPFSSHNFPSLYYPAPDGDSHPAPESPPAFVPAPPFEQSSSASSSSAVVPTSNVVIDTKAALPRDTKDASPSAASAKPPLDDGEPPPPYTEGSSPLDAFTYVMAAAGGAASIITQVQQGGPAPINTLSAGSDEHISLDLRCFDISFLLSPLLFSLTQPGASASPSLVTSSSLFPNSSSSPFSPTVSSPMAT